MIEQVIIVGLTVLIFVSYAVFISALCYRKNCCKEEDPLFLETGDYYMPDD